MLKLIKRGNNLKLLFLMSIFLSSNALADWILWEELEDVKMYYNNTTITKSKYVVNIWTLTDYVRATDNSYKSILMHEEHDCLNKKYIFKRAYSFTENMMGGIKTEIYGTGNYVKVKDKTIADYLHSRICQIEA
jgi:hypothetical protein